jgi:hypothetical protein
MQSPQALACDDFKLPGLESQRTAVAYRFRIVGRREAKGRLVLLAG